jgi:hypothetical protein
MGGPAGDSLERRNYILVVGAVSSGLAGPRGEHRDCVVINA